MGNFRERGQGAGVLPFTKSQADLKPNTRIRIGSQGDNPGGQRLRAFKKALAELERMLADPRIGVFHGPFHVRRLQSSIGVEQAERVNAGLRRGPRGCQRFQVRGNGMVLPLQQKTVCGLPVPAIWIGELLDQFGRAFAAPRFGFKSPRRSGWLGVGRSGKFGRAYRP